MFDILKNIFISVTKIIKGVLSFPAKVAKAIKKFFTNAFAWMKKMTQKYGQEEGLELKGNRHLITKEGGIFKEITELINYDEEYDEYYSKEIRHSVEEKDVPEEYRKINEDEMIDDTEEFDSYIKEEQDSIEAVLQF